MKSEKTLNRIECEPSTKPHDKAKVTAVSNGQTGDPSPCIRLTKAREKASVNSIQLDG